MPIASTSRHRNQKADGRTLMKIMRGDSWQSGTTRGGRPRIYAQQGRTGVCPLGTGPLQRCSQGLAGIQGTGDRKMVWETPQAIDLRFGMEITMYIATR